MRQGAILALALAALLLAGCNGDDDNRDGGGVKDLGPTPDKPQCKRPPNIQSCTGPGTGACPTKVLCLGCECAGLTPLYACNEWTWDCRWFCTGCYPADYSLCDENASKALLGICGYCSDDSGPPGKCNKAYPDMGPDKGPGKDKGKG